MLTDRHRPGTDRETCFLSVNNDNDDDDNDQQNLEKHLQHQDHHQLQSKSSRQTPPPSFFHFTHPLLERISLFSCKKVQDIIKISHTNNHLQEFAHHYSVAVFRNLVRTLDQPNYIEFQEKIASVMGSMKDNNNSTIISVSPNERKFKITELLREYSLRRPNVEKALNLAIQPETVAVSAWTSPDVHHHNNNNNNNNNNSSSLLLWMIDSITAAGFFGYGLGGTNAFSFEFAKFPIHRAITYSSSSKSFDLVRLMLKRYLKLLHYDKELFSQPLIFCQDSFGSTILHYAVEQKNEALVAHILEHTNNLARQISNSNNNNNNSHQHHQEKENTREVFASLLSVQDDQGSTVLHSAARAGQKTILRMLLRAIPRTSSELEGNKNIIADKLLNQTKNIRELTPLGVAISYYQHKLVKIFLEEDQRSIATMEMLEFAKDEHMKKLIVENVRARMMRTMMRTKSSLKGGDDEDENNKEEEEHDESADEDFDVLKLVGDVTPTEKDDASNEHPQDRALDLQLEDDCNSYDDDLDDDMDGEL